ncbi:hypothetical protein AAC387_Pa09g0593 [Persea americana]
MKGEMSALAVGDKRRKKSGGCIGVLFQLFKWKCLVKKKELLSPGRSKRISKRFGGPEISPMAKRLLFADENSSGSPNREKLSLVDVEQNDGMQTPGVVARLMGLESMPVVCHDKPKKASGQGNKSANHFSSSEEHSKIFSGGSWGYNLEKGSAKANLRPQKLQKAGVSDRQPVNKSGAGALQLKKALSCSKNQPRKLVSPVKTTRVLSGRNASRLMEAAAKILEPGLKETNRTRRSLAYSASSNESLNYQTRIEGMAVKQSAQPSYPFTTKSLKGQPPFNSCGDSKVMDCRPNNGVQVPVSGSSAPVCNNDSSYRLGKSNMQVSSLKKQRNAKTQRPVSIINQDGGMSQAAQARVNVLRTTQNSTGRKPRLKHHDLSTSNWQSRTLSSLKQNNLKQNMMLLAGDEVLPRQKLCNQQSRSCSPADGDKENNELNRNMNTCSMQTRMPMKVSGYSKIGMERNASDRKDESSSKLRTLTQNEGPVSCPHIDDICLPAIASVNQITVRNNANDAKENWKAHDASSSKDADIVSFTFNYPMRLCAKTFSTVELTEKQKGHCDLSCNASSPCKKVISDARNGIALPQRMVDSIGGAFSTLIEQRIREISCLEADDFAKADSLPRKSNASVLEEVSAVVAGRLFSQVNRDGSSVNFGSKDSLHRLDANYDSKKCRKFNTTTKFQADARPQAFTMCLLPTDYDRCSPTSILEASFSSDSCPSASLDGSLGYNPLMESTHHLALPMHPDADLIDIILSMSKGTAGRRYLTDFVISSCKMHRIDPAEIGNSGNKFNYVWEVLSNMELLFGNDVPYNAGGMGGSLLGSLLNKLETLADSPWQQPRRNLGIAGSMERNQLRGWLFDCVLEFLDSKYSHYCKSGFRTWENFPVSLGIEKWTREVYNEIRRWSGLPGKTVDEMVEREFSSSLGKWTNFDIETYETGTLVEEDIFQVLLDELVMDLGGWKAASV